VTTYESLRFEHQAHQYFAKYEGVRAIENISEPESETDIEEVSSDSDVEVVVDKQPRRSSRQTGKRRKIVISDDDSDDVSMVVASLTSRRSSKSRIALSKGKKMIVSDDSDFAMDFASDVDEKPLKRELGSSSKRKSPRKKEVTILDTNLDFVLDLTSDVDGKPLRKDKQQSTRKSKVPSKRKQKSKDPYCKDTLYRILWKRIVLGTTFSWHYCNR
jgi:mRNA-degrading endonuclease toxin of MazEF toxin-antitoxin module